MRGTSTAVKATAELPAAGCGKSGSTPHNLAAAFPACKRVAESVDDHHPRKKVGGSWVMIR